MEDMIKKVVTCEVKEIADRTLEFIGSTEVQDRDGEVILAKGWDLSNYKQNPVFMWAHRYDQPPIGRSLKTWAREGKLKFHIEFAPKETYEFADTIYKLYKAGFLKATSVGFIPDPEGIIEGDGEKSPKRTYSKQELLELSAVPVPSNPEALVQAREAGLITVKEFEVCEGEFCSVTKPEETDDWIRIPIRECDVTATIDISKKEGIKALYCGKEKKIRTYMFDKRPPYNWTMAKAKKWVEEHKDNEPKQETYDCECIECGYKMESEKHCADIKCPKCGGEMRRAERPGPGRGEENLETKGAIPYKKTPLAPEDAEWDAGKEVKEAEIDDLKVMCTWVGDDPENKTSYKLPHHKASGDHACVWRAVAAAGAVLMGARGGVNIPDSDLAAVRTHIAKHYADFDKGKPPWEKEISQAEIGDELDYIKSLIEKEGMNEEVLAQAWELTREIMRLAGDEIPEDILLKVGAVLNQKNRQKLNDIKRLAQEILDSAGQEEPKDDKQPEIIFETTKELSKEDITNIIQAVVKNTIEKAQGKI
jgi:HK97 family phage prohead protease